MPTTRHKSYLPFSMNAEWNESGDYDMAEREALREEAFQDSISHQRELAESDAREGIRREGIPRRERHEVTTAAAALVQRPIRERATGYSGRKPSDLFHPSEREFDESKAIRVTEVGEPLQDEDVGLRSLQAECWQTAENHGFHDIGMTVGDRLMLIVSEAAEALEAHREGHAPDESWYEKDGTKICGVPSELADIIVRVLDMAEVYGVDLLTVLQEKMAYNKSRPFLHGKTM